MPKITKKLVNQYIKSLDTDQYKAYKIAQKQLETSFNIKKSIGFKKWMQKNNK